MTVYNKNSLVSFDPANLREWVDSVNELYDVLGGRSEQKISHDNLAEYNTNADYQHITAEEKERIMAAVVFAEDTGSTHKSHQHQIEYFRYKDADKSGVITTANEIIPGTVTLIYMIYTKTKNTPEFSGTPQYRIILPGFYSVSKNRILISSSLGGGLNYVPANTIVYAEYAYTITI